MSDCQRRLQNELKKLKKYSDELKKGSDTVKEEDDLLKVTETIWISLNEKNLRSFTALIQGNEGTPYMAGMYLFSVTIPDSYPHKPPVVKILTGDGSFRTHPNLYAGGKVCLSILGTWQGESWSQCMTISTVLIQIQALFTEDPLTHEPGWDKKEAQGRYGRGETQYKQYKETVEHGTLRIMLSSIKGHIPAVGKAFLPLMQRQFLRRYREIIRFAVKKSQEQPQPKCIPQHPYQHAEKVDYKARIADLKKMRSELLAKMGQGTSGAVAGGSGQAAQAAPPPAAATPTPPRPPRPPAQSPGKRKRESEVIDLTLD